MTPAVLRVTPAVTPELGRAWSLPPGPSCRLGDRRLADHGARPGAAAAPRARPRGAGAGDGRRGLGQAAGPRRAAPWRRGLRALVVGLCAFAVLLGIGEALMRSASGQQIGDELLPYMDPTIAGQFQPPPPATCDAQGRPIAPTSYSCKFCNLITALITIGDGYAFTVYAAIANAAQALAKILAALAFLIFAGRLMVFPREGAEALVQLVGTGFWLFVVFLLLSGGSSAEDTFAFAWIFHLMQQTALDLGAFVLGSVGQVSGGYYQGGIPALQDVGGTGASALAKSYAGLWAHVELTMYPIAEAGWELMSPYKPHTWFMALLLLAPYVFVVLIFGAFLVQSQFYFVAVATVGPALVSAMVIPKWRGYAWAGLKICLSASLTIVFAAAAMGFTGAAVMESSAVVYCAHSNQSGFMVELTDSAQRTAFFQLVIMGFVSAMLHLAGPRLASNISGANDSAGTAAATVAAAQYLGARTLGGLKGGMLGKLGVMGRMPALEQGGAVGAAGTGLQKMMQRANAGER